MTSIRLETRPGKVVPYQYVVAEDSTTDSRFAGKLARTTFDPGSKRVTITDDSGEIKVFQVSKKDYDVVFGALKSKGGGGSKRGVGELGGSSRANRGVGGEERGTEGATSGGEGGSSEAGGGERGVFETGAMHGGGAEIAGRETGGGERGGSSGAGERGVYGSGDSTYGRAPYESGGARQSFDSGGGAAFGMMMTDDQQHFRKSPGRLLTTTKNKRQMFASRELNGHVMTDDSKENVASNPAKQSWSTDASVGRAAGKAANPSWMSPIPLLFKKSEFTVSSFSGSPPKDLNVVQPYVEPNIGGWGAPSLEKPKKPMMDLADVMRAPNNSMSPVSMFVDEDSDPFRSAIRNPPTRTFSKHKPFNPVGPLGNTVVNKQKPPSSSLLSSLSSSSSSSSSKQVPTQRLLLNPKPSFYPTTTSSGLKISSSPPRWLTMRLGFWNTGNSCYCNSVIQAMISCETFAEELKCTFWDKVASKLLKDEDALAFFEITRTTVALALKGEKVSPSATLKKMLGESFSSSLTQQDAHEFFLAVFHKIDRELQSRLVGNTILSLGNKEFPEWALSSQEVYALTTSGSPERASERVRTRTLENFIPHHRVFESTLQIRATCEHCQFSRTTRETFLNHSLDIIPPRGDGEACELMDLLKAHFSPEIRNVDCERCKQGKMASYSSEFVQLPRVLVLHAKRFIVNPLTSETEKVNSEVSVPKNLDLSPYVGTDVYFPNRPELTPPPALDKYMRASYELTAVVEHRGTGAQFGHYITRACVTKTGEWVTFNDEKVLEVDEDWMMSVKFKKSGFLFFFRLQEKRGEAAAAAEATTFRVKSFANQDNEVIDITD